MKVERKVELERQYHADRAAILSDEWMSWEKKMRAVLELFNRYQARLRRRASYPSSSAFAPFPQGLSRPTCRW